MKYEKIPYIKLVPIILISFILFRVINNIEHVEGLIGKVFSLFSFFVWGFAIAYLLNPLMMYIEKKTKMKRGWTLLIVYALLIGIIVLVCILIVPVLVKNIFDLISNMPDYVTKLQNWAIKLTTTNKYLLNTNVSTYIQDTIKGISENANGYIGTGLTIVFNNLVNLSNILIKIGTGIVISIYLLNDKENLLFNIKKLLTIITGEKASYKLIRFGNKVNIIFKQFVIGKLIDSVIVGFICFITVIFLKIPYAIFISIIIGVTNMIPYFGGFIGMGIACLITIFNSPIKALEVAIMMIILGEIDGLYLSPKILGEKIGLNPLWIILGITVGGGLYGVIGMFLGVPVVAIIKVLLQEFMEKKLKEQKLN